MLTPGSVGYRHSGKRIGRVAQREWEGGGGGNEREGERMEGRGGRRKGIRMVGMERKEMERKKREIERGKGNGKRN